MFYLSTAEKVKAKIKGIYEEWKQNYDAPKIPKNQPVKDKIISEPIAEKYIPQMSMKIQFCVLILSVLGW